MEINDDLKNELEIIIKKWINLLQNLDPQFMEMLKLQLNYENRIENLREFLKKEVDNEIKKAFQTEFPEIEYTAIIKQRLNKITSNNYNHLLEIIKKLK